MRKISNALLTLLAYGTACLAGVVVRGAFFWVLFFWPSWCMEVDILLLWGWIGMPIGLVGAVACVLWGTGRLGRNLASWPVRR